MLAQTHASGCSLEGPRKNVIDVLQKRLDFYTAKSNRLRYAQNSHVPISRLPAETLSEVFLSLVESGIGDDDTSFTSGTFDFLRVCRRWNEVAVGFPRLWVWRIPGAVKAWPLFSTRSKGAPLFLTWRSVLPTPAQDFRMDPTIPERIHRLDFRGNIEPLAQFMDAFNSDAPSSVSSIRFYVINLDHSKRTKRLDRFFSSSFPKLVVFDIDGFLPHSSSPIFTTSNLTSLKLRSHCYEKCRYTLSQLSEILQQHPNLQELDLNEYALPLAGPSVPLVSLVLPRLVDLRLHGSMWGVVGLIDLIGVSSPLHNIDIFIQESHSTPTPTPIGVVKKILAMHYECPGLDCPRTTDHLDISSDSLGYCLSFDAGSRSTSASHPTPNLKFCFTGLGAGGAYGLVEDTFPLLWPMDDVREFTVGGLKLSADVYRTILQKMGGLLDLRLTVLEIEPVLDVLGVDHQGMCTRATKMISNNLYTRRWSASIIRPQTTIIVLF